MKSLREQMSDAMILRGFAARTQESYLAAVRALAKHYHRSPDLLTAEEVQAYHLHLIVERKLAYSSVNQSASACRFLFDKVLKRPQARFDIPMAYGFIGRFQGFVGGGKTPEALARELFDAYRKNKQTQKRMGEVLLNLFEDSGSFVAAKERIGYLEQLEVWDSSFVPRLEAAAEANSQISGSWGVPGRVQALAKKWAGV